MFEAVTFITDFKLGIAYCICASKTKVDGMIPSAKDDCHSYSDHQRPLIPKPKFLNKLSLLIPNFARCSGVLKPATNVGSLS